MVRRWIVHFAEKSFTPRARYYTEIGARGCTLYGDVCTIGSWVRQGLAHGAMAEGRFSFFQNPGFGRLPPLAPDLVRVVSACCLFFFLLLLSLTVICVSDLTRTYIQLNGTMAHTDTHTRPKESPRDHDSLLGSRRLG